ncbi:hypothetical protein Hypma_003193 [Hypsizygus marmoreus]|uniref:Secreted protein n=1 Tax=Hypsizygus marmoreus TaxID=39966 RepID=A0A369KA02_HYPMA|nr:hypothetical protein Hypma_003193 [Hypsizygus marmoreus]
MICSDILICTLAVLTSNGACRLFTSCTTSASQELLENEQHGGWAPDRDGHFMQEDIPIKNVFSLQLKQNEYLFG